MALNLKRTEATEAPVNEAAQAAVEAPVAEAPAVVVNNENTGIWSDKIAFVASLGNPLRDDVTKITVDGKEEKKVTPFIVGYRFKALMDIVIPDCGTTDAFKKNYMDYNDITGKREVKAGETFDVTPFEMAALASYQEINRTFAGGDRVATCAYAFKQFRGKMSSGTGVKDEEVPRAMLRLAQGSIKDCEIIPVLTMTKEMDASGKERRKGTINPGFEKWAPLCKVTERSVGAPRGEGSRAKTNTYDQNAANFAALIAQKGFSRA